MHRPYRLHWPYTGYMAKLYTKQGAIKLSKMLIKCTHHPHRLPQQTRTGRRTAQTLGRGILRNAESCQRVICGKFDADFFCGMKGKLRNESMRNVTEMNIY